MIWSMVTSSDKTTAEKVPEISMSFKVSLFLFRAMDRRAGSAVTWVSVLMTQPCVFAVCAGGYDINSVAQLKKCFWIHSITPFCVFE